MRIHFASREHRDFYHDMMAQSRRQDCYHQAFFYVMGIAPETRANIRQMFDFKRDCIAPEGMHGGWQTSGTVRVCQLAFYLYTEWPASHWKIEKGRQTLPPHKGKSLFLTLDSLQYLHIIVLFHLLPRSAPGNIPGNAV